MRVTTIVYYSALLIICLFIVNRMMGLNSVFEGTRDEIRTSFSIYCVFFVSWSFLSACIGISTGELLDKCLLLLAEIMKILTFVFGAELCASITDRTISLGKASHTITSEMAYFGMAVLVIRVFIGRVAIQDSYFGQAIVMSNWSIILNAIYYACVVFFFAAYTYMYSYSCKTRRERYISRNCIVIVSTLAIALIIETFGYAFSNMFIPSMYVGMLITLMIFKDLIRYKRSIEYNEDDYFAILNSANQKPAFVCDDEGKILFENTRAFVMKQTYKDDYRGRLLTDIFEITDYDIERLKDPRITQVFDVYCRYSKEPKEMLLSVKHKLDKFGAIFATEVEVGYAIATEEEVVAASSDIAEKELLEVSLSDEEVRELRTKGLISQLELQKKLYESGNRDLFEYNLKGISKAAGVLSLTALEDLCDRIQTELSYGEWQVLESMMIDIDRQYETLKMLNT